MRHLLSRRSGLPDYTDQAILGTQVEGLSKAWMAEELYEMVADLPLLFGSGREFHLFQHQLFDPRGFSEWALTDSNRRPLPCKGSALAN